MASDINKKIAQLRARRIGSDRITLDESVRTDVIAKLLYPTQEAWEKRARNKPATLYVIGALEAVDKKYTQISLDTANRVGNQLKTRLQTQGYEVDFRLQGSVPLDVHIRGVSDVDLLTLDTSFLTYTTEGERGRNGAYSPTSKNSLSVLTQLRKSAELALKEAFPVANVDISGSKAICISGGSLPRVVDVVPAHWHDNNEYQKTLNENVRGVTILNKKIQSTIENLPFLHIHLIRDRCNSVQGTLRKSIRLCKNVKADEEADGNNINLPSFDIASIMYHANLDLLKNGVHFELEILNETQRHLDKLACNHELAKTLRVPDGSRSIFDTNEKLLALNQLSLKMDQLLRDVAKEHSSLSAITSETSLLLCRNTLKFVMP